MFMSGPGNNPTKTKWDQFFPGFETEPKSFAVRNPDRWQVTPTHRRNHFEQYLKVYLNRLKSIYAIFAWLS